MAVARDIGQAMPVIDSYAGPSEAFQKMTVSVTVTATMLTAEQFCFRMQMEWVLLV
jgi:hypothetical protein